MAPGPNGSLVRVRELPNTPCTGGTPGCYEQHVIMGYGSDMQARQHELDHVAGMRHGEWFQSGNGDKCAVIVAGGHTLWKIGHLLCRGSRGDYYQVEP